jgi:N-acetylneuraminate synthase
MITTVRDAQAALGDVRYGPSSQEKPSTVFRRSLFVVRHVKAGEPFTEQNVRIIRPGTGLHPRHLDDVMDRRAARDLAPGTPLAWDHIVP